MAKYCFTFEDIEPLMEGLAVLGTGGGGNPRLGKAILENDMKLGREINLVDPEDVPDDALIVSGGIMGSVQFLDKMDTKKLIARWEERFELLEAAKVMESYLGKKIDYVVPFEVGGLNTPVIMSLAARLGIGVINGDALGRSAPETQMTSFLGHGVSLVPMPLVDANGNTIIVTDQSETVFADEIGRWMITKGGGMGANNHYPMSGKQLKECVIPKTVTKAIAIGRAILKARQEKTDPVVAVIEEVNGFKLFQGKVTEVEGEDRGGFYVTNVNMEGCKDFNGMKAKMVIKNETMALWVDNTLKSVFPDLVCMLDPENGSGIMSTDIVVGKEMVLVGQPCHERLRKALKSSAASQAFGGERYGHPELSYIPIEELNPGK